jgi:hypothetical protein
MTRIGILLVAVCLTASSGCLCRGICTKRANEECCPTDIRKTHFWCFGEDAFIQGPCGPKEELYGYEPTCWREFPEVAAACYGVDCNQPPLPSAENQEELPVGPSTQSPPAGTPNLGNPFRNDPAMQPAPAKGTRAQPAINTSPLPQQSGSLLDRNGRVGQATNRGFVDRVERAEPIVNAAIRDRDSHSFDGDLSDRQPIPTFHVSECDQNGATARRPAAFSESNLAGSVTTLPPAEISEQPQVGPRLTTDSSSREPGPRFTVQDIQSLPPSSERGGLLEEDVTPPELERRQRAVEDCLPIDSDNRPDAG